MKKVIPYIAAVLAIVLVVILVGIAASSGTESPSASPSPTVSASAEPSPSASPSPSPSPGPEMSVELKALLDASSAPMACLTIIEESGGVIVDGNYRLFVKALLAVDANNPDLRAWSDAMSTYLAGASPEEMRMYLYKAICEEPFIGVSLAHLFAHLEVSGVSILELQSTDWLKPFAVDSSEIDNLVGQYVPLEVLALQNPGVKPTEEQYIEAAKANRDYQELASRLVFLLSRYQLAGVMSIDSTHHYHLVAGGLRADGLPEVEVSSSIDSRPALVFYLTEKTSCVPISVIGFNTGDKRPMLGVIPQDCETFTPPPTVECVESCTTPPCEPGKCLNPKTGHVPTLGTDDTTDDGDGDESLATVDTEAEDEADDVDTTRDPDPVVTLPPQDGKNNGTVSD